MPLLSLEGLDGSGKSTVIDAIQEEYDDVITTAEPSELQYGQLVRERLSQDDSNEMIDFYLFMADRISNINDIIKPAEKEGKLVVSDRYSDSTRAYQPVALTGEDKPFDSVWNAKHYVQYVMTPWEYEPHLTIYIDISVETALQRCDESEKYEKRQFLEQVHENYNGLVEAEERIVAIDGEESPENVADSAIDVIESELSHNLSE